MGGCGADLVQPFQIESLGIRGRLVRLGPTLEAAMWRHGYPVPVRIMLAETLALAAVLSSGLRYDGVFTLQVQGDGPIGLLQADVTSDGGLRAHARFERDRLERAACSSGDPVPRLIGSGFLVFTVDQGPAMERHQGITGLTGPTLAECAHDYFRRSEPLDTAILLAASPVHNGEIPEAAGLVIQRPASGHARVEADEEESWRRAVTLMSSASASDLLDSTLSPHDLLYRLYHEEGVRVFRTRSLRHACRCSHGRVTGTLRSFPRNEIEDMAVSGVVTVTCEFCKREYAFDETALARVYESA